MNLPSPEVRQQLLALHVLLGAPHLTDERREEFRRELIKLLAAHGFKWTDWPEFFSLQNIQCTHALPPVNSSRWKKERYSTICHLHSQIGNDDKTGTGTHKKLIEKISKQGLSWSSDLPAILAADWAYKNPPVHSAATAAAAPDAPTVNVFSLTKRVIGDRQVMKPSELTITTLITLNTYVYDRFVCVPGLGAIAPTSGHGKTTLLHRVLEHLVFESWYTSDPTAASFYRRVRSTPKFTAILDQREHQLGAALWNLIDYAFEGGAKDLTIDGEPVHIVVFVPVFWGIRGEIHDVPPSILSRSLQILLQKGKPKIRLKGRDPASDPAYFEDLIITREEIRRWAPTADLSIDPELPAELDNDRFADVVRPLVSIADALGCGAEARAALIELCAARPPQDMGVQVLIDARTVSKELGVDRISKSDLAKAIVKYGHHYWAHWRGPKDNKEPHELTALEVGILFDRFHVYPSNIWPTGPRKPGTTTFWGYHFKDFKQAWAEHCPEEPSAQVIPFKPQPS